MDDPRHNEPEFPELTSTEAKELEIMLPHDPFVTYPSPVPASKMAGETRPAIPQRPVSKAAIPSLLGSSIPEALVCRTCQHSAAMGSISHVRFYCQQFHLFPWSNYPDPVTTSTSKSRATATGRSGGSVSKGTTRTANPYAETMTFCALYQEDETKTGKTVQL